LSPALRDLEVLRRHCALGLRFWDVATGGTVIDGLRVDVFARANPHRREVARPNRSGVYVAHSVPGLRDFEFSDAPEDGPWAVALRPYRVEVDDPFGRFLPCAFDADLPERGLFTWRAPWMSPPAPIAWPPASGSPPMTLVQRVPLFSAPQRPVPEPLAVVYAQMREENGSRPAAWGLLQAAIGGEPRGLGLSDAEGRVAVMFPYPEPPRPPLASPPPQRDDFAWTVELTAYYAFGSPPGEPGARADLAAVLAQLDEPHAVLVDGVGSPPGLRLEYRTPLVARSPGGSPDDRSHLLVRP
jgi:hypothetical protein